MLSRRTHVPLGALMLLAATQAAGAQVVQIPERVGPPPIWVSASAGLFDLQGFHGGEDGGFWNWGGGVQLRGSVERSLRSDMTIGLTGSYARLPLSVTGGGCVGCQGDATVWQTMAALRLGGGGGRVGFHSVFEVAGGVTGFAQFERGTDASPVPGALSVPAQRIAPSLGAGYGVGYTLTPAMELSLTQEIGFIRYSRSEAAPSGSTSMPRFQTTRLTLRFAPAMGR